MRRIAPALKYFFSKADMLLLFLCVATTIFGTVIISSATQHFSDTRYIWVQLAALVLGIFVYIFFTLVDIDIIAERREVLYIFNIILNMLLFTPFGVDVFGNRSWLDFPVLPFNIQPGEICKLTFIILLAKTMSTHQRTISKPTTVLRLGFEVIFMFLLVIVSSRDDGVAMMYILIFLVMAWTGGVSWIWFALGIGAVIIVAPIAFELEIGGRALFDDYQKNRILMLFDETIDPTGEGVRWHTNNSLLTLTNGGVTGMGLFNGARTKIGALSQQHTDFIFSVIGEELGIVGCVFIILLLLAIVARCIFVGVKAGSYMNRQICIGIAGMMIWQIFINVGMCIGLTPVIGLTLPFVSYGGSSLLTMFAAMGIISGIHMRPAPDTGAHYIRPAYYRELY
ncbi:MAG: FtsW/RodA/SpoVE family cell cycle protein [Oscillospiraceae bacterium]|nr:FtsW/RodA/SpoVE family cell cycle protein [Oscillospiraceae bacterium]